MPCLLLLSSFRLPSSSSSSSSRSSWSWSPVASTMHASYTSPINTSYTTFHCTEPFELRYYTKLRGRPMANHLQWNSFMLSRSCQLCSLFHCDSFSLSFHSFISFFPSFFLLFAPSAASGQAADSTRGPRARVSTGPGKKRAAASAASTFTPVAGTRGGARAAAAAAARGRRGLQGVMADRAASGAMGRARWAGAARVSTGLQSRHPRRESGAEGGQWRWRRRRGEPGLGGLGWLRPRAARAAAVRAPGAVC